MQHFCGYFLFCCAHTQVLESVWAVLVNNVALLVNVVVSIVSLVFGSGTAILNTVLEVVCLVIHFLISVFAIS